MQTLTLINQIIIGIVSVAFTFQIIYLFLFFLKPERYRKAETKHKFAIVVPAHNEADVISATVRNLLLQKYPKDKFRVFVIADNCTDDTAEKARRAGAEVYERHESDAKKRSRAFSTVYHSPMEKATVTFSPLPDGTAPAAAPHSSGIATGCTGPNSCRCHGGR